MPETTFTETIVHDDLLLLETILCHIGPFLHIQDVAALESCCKRFQSETGPIWTEIALRIPGLRSLDKESICERTICSQSAQTLRTSAGGRCPPWCLHPHDYAFFVSMVLGGGNPILDGFVETASPHTRVDSDEREHCVELHFVSDMRNKLDRVLSSAEAEQGEFCDKVDEVIQRISVFVKAKGQYSDVPILIYNSDEIYTISKPDMDDDPTYEIEFMALKGEISHHMYYLSFSYCVREQTIK